MRSVTNYVVVSQDTLPNGQIYIIERHSISDGTAKSLSWVADPSDDLNAALEQHAQDINDQLAAEDAARQRVGQYTVWPTPAEFMLRFTAQERLAIRQAAATDPVISDFEELLLAATAGVDTNSQPVKGGLAYLVSKGLLTQARADAILSGA